MVLITDVDRLEALYADGQKVKAIHECREIAIRALPGHAARLQAELDKHTSTQPTDRIYFETFIYRHNTCEDANAATVVVWCAKWLVGRSDTRTEYEFGSGRKRAVGEVRQRTSRTVVISDREDFASNAFIALRMMADQATPVQLADTAEQRQTTRLARLRELGGDRVYKGGKWCASGHGTLAMLQAEIMAIKDKPFSPKSISDDLDKAAGRERELIRSGTVYNRLGSR